MAPSTTERPAQGRIVSTSLAAHRHVSDGWDLASTCAFGRIQSTRPRERHNGAAAQLYRAGDGAVFLAHRAGAGPALPGAAGRHRAARACSDEPPLRSSRRAKNSEALVAELDDVFRTRHPRGVGRGVRHPRRVVGASEHASPTPSRTAGHRRWGFRRHAGGGWRRPVPGGGVAGGLRRPRPPRRPRAARGRAHRPRVLASSASDISSHIREPALSGEKRVSTAKGRER